MEKIPATLDKLVVPVGEVRPTPGNPRRGDVGAIAESLDRNGQYRPIVVNRRTQEILAGNHTYAAAVHLGWERIAVTFVDVDEDQAARIVLADNRTADMGRYDDDALLAMLRRFDEDGLVGSGYTLADLDAIAALTSEGVMDLDELADEVGEFSERDGWPVLRLVVPPVVARAWREHVVGFKDEGAALARLLGVEVDGE